MEHDENLFNFINKLTTIQLDKNDSKKFSSQTDGDSMVSNNSFSSEFSRLKKDFKVLRACDQVDLGSTGNSDKSLSSFGSESNDLNVENNLGPSESILSSHIGVVDPNGVQVREFSQSPAFFGFSSSNSSSPPLSQTSGASSASSLSEAVSTLANGFNSNSANVNNISNATRDFFNSQSNLSKSSGISLTAKNENSAFISNPLDNMFSSILSYNSTNNNRNDSISDSFSLLDNSSFGQSDTFNLEQRRFGSNVTQTNLLPTSFSQDSLPHFFQNSFLSFSANISDRNELTSPNVAQNRKFSMFNSNNNNVANNTSCTTSPIISTPFFSSNNLLFKESFDPRSTHNSMTPNMGNSNFNMQVRFESHIRTIANEINSTVQLYINSLQMRKEQLLKQLDHLRNTYFLLLSQNKTKSNKVNHFPKITFTRPDSSLFKLVTSCGLLNSPAFAPYCQLTGEGLTVAVEGEPTCFSVSTRNCFNEDINTGKQFI